jgi:hypothetical protein
MTPSFPTTPTSTELPLCTVVTTDASPLSRKCAYSAFSGIEQGVPLCQRNRRELRHQNRKFRFGQRCQNPIAITWEFIGLEVRGSRHRITTVHEQG